MNQSEPFSEMEQQKFDQEELILWKRNPDVVGRKVAGEYVLVPITQTQVDLQSMYSLNPIGAFLWDELKTAKSKDDLVSSLLARYKVSDNQAYTDVSNFLTDLYDRNLISREVD